MCKVWACLPEKVVHLWKRVIEISAQWLKPGLLRRRSERDSAEPKTEQASCARTRNTGKARDASSVCTSSGSSRGVKLNNIKDTTCKSAAAASRTTRRKKKRVVGARKKKRGRGVRESSQTNLKKKYKKIKKTSGRELYQIILYWSQLVIHNMNKNETDRSAQKEWRK